MKKPNQLLFVNSLLRGGIRDFGLKLSQKLNLNNIEMKYTEIGTGWTGLIKLYRLILSKNKTIIYNLGFTSLGNSRLTNFVNFLMIGLLSRAGIIFKVILHDSPEIMDRDSTFQSLNGLTMFASKVVIFLLRKTTIFVISVKMRDLLSTKYKIQKLVYYPFPCDLGAEKYKMEEGPLSLFTIGHVLPYKGFDLLPELKSFLPGIRMMCIGGKSPTLQGVKEYNSYYENLKNQFNDREIITPGYLSLEEIRKLFSTCKPIGVLPYRSVSGSSASAIFFIERGIPIITTDLDEFRQLKDLGASIVLSERFPQHFADKILSFFEDDSIFRIAYLNNARYCEKYNYLKLLEIILQPS